MPGNRRSLNRPSISKYPLVTSVWKPSFLTMKLICLGGPYEGGTVVVNVYVPSAVLTVSPRQDDDRREGRDDVSVGP